jgi:hypothetical protein
VEGRVVMGWGGQAAMMELAGRRVLVLVADTERTRHAKMHQQQVAGAQISHEVLGAAAEAGDGLALKPGNEIRRAGRFRQVGTACRPA